MMDLRAGDVGVLLAGAGVVVTLAVWGWGGAHGDTVVIRAAGKVIETASLTRARTYAVQGPLGTTEIEIRPGRARIARDPSPRQLCVKQGWLTQAGQAALCLPNQVSLEIRGRAVAYDTLGY
ncbi:NusG domain II-containing protein [Thiobacillus sedimenti]|uniref:NusG domain II-containing protein n=1 Tax=Thiobacillus sedimenti TaxID=3110231 RepID=A0ABZ1CKQ3_9PROT|nr:NusG domain II-containing protein [Thiobacillus sp. SCUT-2]WRS39847.1 NusG domain II-containing protein [Thiobacillus sp. SCUT-2]